MKRNKIFLIAACFCVFQFLSQHMMGQYEPVAFPNNLQNLIISKGTLNEITLHSKALENNFLGESPDKKVTIYLPPGYDNAPDTHYPVIYLLHGWNGNNNYFFDPQYFGLRLKEMLDTLIYRNVISPFIVVAPGSITEKYWCSNYTNSIVTGNWEDFIVKDLVNYTESNYRTLPELNSRGIAGHSMGGFGAMKIAMIHPDIFSSVYTMSGPLDFKNYLVGVRSYMLQSMKVSDLNGLDPYLLFPISFAAAFSPDTTSEPFYCQFPIDTAGAVIDSIWSKWLVNDPYTMVPIYKDNLLKLRAIQFGCGTSEILEIDKQNDQFSEVLTENGIDHVYMNFIGDHMSSVQEQMKSQVLPFFSTNLDHSIPGISRSASIVDPADTLEVEMDTDGTVYIVPVGTLAVMDSIIKFHVLSSTASANTKVYLPLNGIPCGEYVLYGADTDSHITIPLPLVVVPDASPPLVTLERNIVDKEDSIRVTSTKDGTIYLVTANTPPEQILTANLKKRSKVLAGKPVSLATSRLIQGTYYWLYATDAYGIHSDAYPVYIDFKNTIEENSKDEVKIYPNPANDLITIQTKGTGTCSIEITKLNGQIVLKKNLTGKNSQIDISGFQKGVYILTVRSEDLIRTEKIIKL